MRRIGKGIGIFLALSALGWFYFGHASTPTEPALKGAVRAEALESGGRTRSFLAYAPPNLPTRGGALVIVLHGTSMDGEQMRRWNGYAYDSLADEHGFAVVYPDGVGRSWNDCRRAGARRAKQENVDDVAFLRDVIDLMRRRHGVETTRVFLVGYSNGGQMAYRMLAEAPDAVAAAAVTAAGYPAPETSVCPAQAAGRPVLLAHGVADRFAPYAGGEAWFFGARPGAVLAAPETAALFARANGLPEKADTHAVSDGIDEKGWRAEGRPPVVLTSLKHGGHTIPQKAVRFPRILGPTIADFDMPRAAIDFFRLAKGLKLTR
jgi:polyhydroxybutyrate depolymerase